MNERLQEQPADEADELEADELEASIGAELTFSIGLALVIAGVGALTATTVALVRAALS